MLPCALQNSFSGASSAMCANVRQIQVYSGALLGAALLMRNATVSVCDSIADRTCLMAP